MWVGLFTLLILTLFSALNFALRFSARARLGERFEHAGRGDAFETFLLKRVQLMLASAVIRSASVLGLFVIVLLMGESPAFQEDESLFISCAIAWGLLLIFGVAIPGAWAKYSGDWLIVNCMPVLFFIRWFCYPVIVILEWFDPLVRRLAGVPLRDEKSYADELEQEILKVVSEGELHGAVDEEEKEMIESVIELTDTRVEEIMTPRTDIVAMGHDTNLEILLETIRKTGHSRIPIYKETIDTIIGVLYAKDMLQRNDDHPFDLTARMRKAIFIPETKLVRDLLREFQEKKVHMAVVLDEYGGTAGLVTIEDILEELVGEIADEYESDAPVELNHIDDTTIEVDARMRIDDLNNELDIELPEDEDYETIGGFVFSTMGKIPKVGEKCEYRNIGILVIASEPRRVTRVRLKLPQKVRRARTESIE